MKIANVSGETVTVAVLVEMEGGNKEQVVENRSLESGMATWAIETDVVGGTGKYYVELWDNPNKENTSYGPYGDDHAIVAIIKDPANGNGITAAAASRQAK